MESKSRSKIFIFPRSCVGLRKAVSLHRPSWCNLPQQNDPNGTVSRQLTSHSRMTNRTVQKSGGTTLVVNYQDGSQTISVPPNVPVTEVAPQQVTFSPGDVVYATTEKLRDGTLVTDKIFQFVPAAAAN